MCTLKCLLMPDLSPISDMNTINFHNGFDIFIEIPSLTVIYHFNKNECFFFCIIMSHFHTKQWFFVLCMYQCWLNNLSPSEYFERGGGGHFLFFFAGRNLQTIRRLTPKHLLPLLISPIPSQKIFLTVTYVRFQINNTKKSQLYGIGKIEFHLYLCCFKQDQIPLLKPEQIQYLTKDQVIRLFSGNEVEFVPANSLAFKKV